jgi:hypothetical protein
VGCPWKITRVYLSFHRQRLHSPPRDGRERIIDQVAAIAEDRVAAIAEDRFDGFLTHPLRELL